MRYGVLEEDFVNEYMCDVLSEIVDRLKKLSVEERLRIVQVLGVDLGRWQDEVEIDLSMDVGCIVDTMLWWSLWGIAVEVDEREGQVCEGD